jgi:hypothetical protein
MNQLAADSLAAMLRSVQMIDVGTTFRQSDALERQNLLTNNLLAISQSLRAHSARTRENARQIRAYVQTLRAISTAASQDPEP